MVRYPWHFQLLLYWFWWQRSGRCCFSCFIWSCIFRVLPIINYHWQGAEVVVGFTSCRWCTTVIFTQCFHIHFHFNHPQIRCSLVMNTEIINTEIIKQLQEVCVMCVCVMTSHVDNVVCTKNCFLLQQKVSSQKVVHNHCTGLLDWNTGLEYWTAK